MKNNKQTPKVEFIKNKKGEIVSVRISEQITLDEFMKHFIKPEIEKAKQQEQKRIGKEFKKWFNSKSEAEDIEDAIIRITDVEI